MKGTVELIKHKNILKRQGFLLASIILIATVFITKVIGMIYRIPLAHILGGSGMAYFSSAYSIFMPVYAIAVSGIPPAVARLTAEQCAVGNYRNARRLRSAAMTFFFLTGLIASLLLIFCARPICDYVIAEPLSRLSVAAVAPCIAIGAIAAVERGYAEGMRNMIPTAVSEIIEAVVKLAAGLGLAFLAAKKADADMAAHSMVFGVHCSNAEEAKAAALPVIAAASVLGVTLSNLCGCAYLWLSRKIAGDGITDDMLMMSQQHTPKRVMLKSLTELAMPFALASVITTLSGVIDLMTINRCLEHAFSLDPAYSLKKFASAVLELSEGEKLSSFIYGSYSGLALTVFGIVPSLTAMFGRSIFPSVSAACATKNKAALSSSVNTVLTLALFIALPCGIGVSVFSEEILRLLFAGRTNEIAVCVNALSVLGLASIPVSLCAPSFMIFQAAGMQREPIKITLIGSIIKLAANILLVSRPRLGITGAGMATLICYMAMLAMCLNGLRRLCGQDPVHARPVLSMLMCSMLSIEGAMLMYILMSEIASLRVSLIISIFFSVNIYILSSQLLSVLPKTKAKLKKSSKSS